MDQGHPSCPVSQPSILPPCCQVAICHWGPLWSPSSLPSTVEPLPPLEPVPGPSTKVPVFRELQLRQLSGRLFTDTCPMGWRVQMEGNMRQRKWEPQEQRLHFNLLEIRAVAKALQWCPLPLDATVLVSSDNSTVVPYINREGDDMLFFPVQSDPPRSTWRRPKTNAGTKNFSSSPTRRTTKEIFIKHALRLDPEADPPCLQDSKGGGAASGRCQKSQGPHIVGFTGFQGQRGYGGHCPSDRSSPTRWTYYCCSSMKFKSF